MVYTEFIKGFISEIKSQARHHLFRWINQQNQSRNHIHLARNQKSENHINRQGSKNIQLAYYAFKHRPKTQNSGFNRSRFIVGGWGSLHQIWVIVEEAQSLEEGRSGGGLYIQATISREVSCIQSFSTCGRKPWVQMRLIEGKFLNFCFLGH